MFDGPRLNIGNIYSIQMVGTMIRRTLLLQLYSSLSSGECSILIILNNYIISPEKCKEWYKWNIQLVQTTVSNRYDLLSWFNTSLVNSR